MSANRMGSFVPAVNHYGEFTSRLLQHQEWQQRALHDAELRRDLRVARNGAQSDVVTARRLPAAIGTLLVRVGQRLQGQPQMSAPAR